MSSSTQIAMNAKIVNSALSKDQAAFHTLKRHSFRGLAKVFLSPFYFDPITTDLIIGPPFSIDSLSHQSGSELGIHRETFQCLGR